MDREDGVKVKGEDRGSETERETEEEKGRERERKREQRTDNVSGVGPFIYASCGTHTFVLPAQPAMIKCLQHEEIKEARKESKKKRVKGKDQIITAVA